PGDREVHFENVHPQPDGVLEGRNRILRLDRPGSAMSVNEDWGGSHNQSGARREQQYRLHLSDRIAIRWHSPGAKSWQPPPAAPRRAPPHPPGPAPRQAPPPPPPAIFLSPSPLPRHLY